jgi:hypothetical protein
MPRDRQQALVPMVHVFTCAVLGAAVLLPTLRELARRRTDRQTGRLLAAALLLAACSPCLPTFVLLTGFMDPILFVLAFSAYGCATRGRLAVAAILCALGPFVHEAFVFVWVGPAGLLLMQGRRARSWRRALGIALVPALATAVVLAFHSPSAASAMIASAPLDEVTKDGLTRYQYGLHIGEALAIMLAQFRAWPLHVVLACGAFLVPSILVTMCAALIAQRSGRFSRWELAALVGCALLPAAALTVAWDLSRLLVWTMPTSILVLHFVAKEADRRDPEPPARTRRSVTIGLAAACGICAVVGFASPNVYAYFDFCTADYELFPPGIDRSLPARVGYLFVNYYNRHRMLDVTIPKDVTARLWLASPQGSTRGEGVRPPLDVASGSLALGVDAQLSPGDYDVSFHLDVTPDCSGGDVAVTAMTLSHRPHALALERVNDVTGPRVVALRVRVDDHDAALGATDFRVQGLDGCVHVSQVLVSIAREARP